MNSSPAAEIAARGLALTAAILFSAFIILLYTETADFQVKVALLGAAEDFCSLGSAVLLVSLLGAIVARDRLG